MKKILSILCSLVILISSIFSINVYAKTEIPIAMSLDNNYTMPTIVAMTSMLENVNSDTVYKFHLLLSGDFKEENKNMILSLKKKYPSKQFEINFIDMKDAYRHNKQRASISVPAYYRLRLADLLKNYDKCIYIDGDTIVEKDLSQLYNIDLQDNYVAGVRNFHLTRKNGSLVPFWQNSYKDVLNISDMNKYINSGVLLMNLKKLRNDKIQDKFNWFIENKVNKGLTICLDQDVINACCYPKIKLLPLKYNALSMNLYPDVRNNKELNMIFGHGEIEEAANNPVILHAVDSLGKPWKNPKMFFADKWAHYFSKCEFLNNDNFINTLPLKNRISLRTVIQAANDK